MENELFDDMYKVETQHWWFVARRKIIANVIRKLKLKTNSKILDVGCGNGDNLELLLDYGELVAIERDDNALARAQARHLGRVVKGDLPDNIPTDININKDNDLIVMLDVLEHIDDDEKSLSVLTGWAKNNGSLLITVPAYQFLWTSHDDINHHKRRYTAKHLKRIIESNGWKVQYISYFNTFLFPLAFIDRIKQRIFPSSKFNELEMPNKYINIIFEKLFSLESYIIGKIAFPFGLSIIVVASKL